MLRTPVGDYWALDVDEIGRLLDGTLEGLSQAEAEKRLAVYGRNQIREHAELSRLRVLWSQLRNPLLLLLVFAAAASMFTGQWNDAVIVLTIVVVSSVIGFYREYNAGLAAAALEARIRVRSKVIRDGAPVGLEFDQIVPGDVILLSAGSLVPADAVVLEANNCYVSEAVLTGESFPVEKKPGKVAAATRLAERSNCVFAGTSVRSGTSRCLVVQTGRGTQFGSIARRLSQRPPEREFERGIRRFGYLLTIAMLLMTLLVFAVHVFEGRSPVETLLFAVALAVGLSPELLPAILTVNLSRSAQMMASRGVLVRHLNAIEDLGSMDILCTDKTGTLTEGVVSVEGAYAPDGTRSSEVLELAAINAALETGLANPLDDGILRARSPDLTGIDKVGEIPFDFNRKRVSIAVKGASGTTLITKGAFDHVIEICDMDVLTVRDLERRYQDWSRLGIRVLAVASRKLDSQSALILPDEQYLTFRGFVTFLDRPREGAAEALADLGRLGVSVKVITGDSRLVAEHVARMVGMRADRVLTGAELEHFYGQALWSAAEQTDLFVEVDPAQKERIIQSLRKMGHVVGFLGDGVNDAPAMHSADTALSVQGAVDVARQAADFVLLEQGLDVIQHGVEEGRKTFANTLKYILTTTSANLGNMVSMALSSAFLPFLPLLPGQILLNNFLSDIPAVGLADDAVDPELTARPRRWNIRFIGWFMIEFGVLSSLFDLLTFLILLQVFRAGAQTFQTAWFVESLLTELVIALVVRTRRPFYKSRPGPLLLWSTVVLALLTLLVPYVPFLGVLGFVPLPSPLLWILVGIVVLYVMGAELLKRSFYARFAE